MTIPIVLSYYFLNLKLNCLFFTPYQEKLVILHIEKSKNLNF